MNACSSWSTLDSSTIVTMSSQLSADTATLMTRRSSVTMNPGMVTVRYTFNMCPELHTCGVRKNGLGVHGCVRSPDTGS
jgi:hypothetical protein